MSASVWLLLAAGVVTPAVAQTTLDVAGEEFAQASAPPDTYAQAGYGPPYGAGGGYGRPDRGDVFARGRVSVSLLVGSALLSDRDWLLLGAGVAYYILGGLELGVEGQAWLFDEPFIGTLTPQFKYVLHRVPILKPYGGGFFRHYWVGDDIDDFNSVGARLGLYLVPGRRSRIYFGAGAVYEHVMDCGDRIRECNSVYPEVTFSLAM